MKSINYLLFILLSVFLFCCKADQKPQIQSGIDNCKHCNMIISQTNQACGFFKENNFVTFCSPSCLLADYENLEDKNMIKNTQIYFTDYNTKIFMPSDSTFFLLTKSIPTVMNSGVVCFNSLENAKMLKREPEDIVTDWRKYKVLAGTPDKIIKIKINNFQMNPGVLVFNKNDIIQLEIEKIGHINNILISIKGYEEVGNFIFTEGISFITVKMIADKPGSGFPIMMEGIDQPIGMIKVLGAHTLDEEVM